jgi:hypothetical protein
MTLFVEALGDPSAIAHRPPEDVVALKNKS